MFVKVTATSIANLNQIDIGFSGSMAGILIAALTKNPSERNDPETPSMVLSSSQATWMGEKNLKIQGDSLEFQFNLHFVADTIENDMRNFVEIIFENEFSDLITNRDNLSLHDVISPAMFLIFNWFATKMMK